MKVNKFKALTNTGKLEIVDDIIDIKRGRWLCVNKISHPLEYIRCNSFDKRNVYFLSKFEKTGFHISLSFLQNQRFLFIQRDHWLQKEENIRYIINILFIILGLIKFKI